MSTCADLGPDLVAHERGELEGEALARLEAHLADCTACSAALGETRAFLAEVRAATEIEPSGAEIAALEAAVDEALEEAAAPVLVSGRVRGAWETAVWRYETSARFRRVTLGSIGVHAAAAAVLGWLLIGGGPPARRPEIKVAPLEPPVELHGDDELPWEPATAEGVPLPPVFAPDGAADIRFPTRGVRAHLAIAGDPVRKAARLRERLGADLAARASAAIERGLERLERAEDPGVAARAAIVLAFATDGRSARTGAHAARLGPSVASLERYVGSAPDAPVADVGAYSLAVRALTWQWALDFRHLSRAERLARQDLLERAGGRLVAAQGPAGDFGEGEASLLATAALADLRLAGVLRPDEALHRAGRYLDRSEPAFAAARLAHRRELGVPGAAPVTLDRLAARLAGAGETDALLRVAGLQALVRHGRPLTAALTATLDAQRADGSWQGDELATALGVLAVTRAYIPDS